ncbi:hypothetical protein GGR50DRAFT_430747 [Xylaria sp. CBS 124048]|nr:hypothetical protein GGR50DRAFT_430747 [Xylaria sp. CBS 124048]
MPSPSRPGLLATPCVTCRQYHLKCDRESPICGRCARAGRECKLSFKFKAGRGGKFGKDQRWLRPPRRLIYVDETPYLMAGDSVDDNVSQQYFYIDDTFLDRPVPYSPGFAASLSGDIQRGTQLRQSPAETISEAPTPDSDSLYPGSEPRIDVVHPRSQDEHSRNSLDLRELQTMQPLPRNPSSHAPSHENPLYGVAALPLKSRTEAILFRHYIEKIAVCLDCCDPLRHFELIVPERATTRHTLLNAIFAIAARHLSHTTDFDPLASNRYHDECLKQLIPMMSHSSAVGDENLFAATIILRMLEEMDGSLTGQDNYSHLLGIHAFVNAGDQHMVPGSLSAASFWVGLRQEIYIAILTQQRVKLNLDDFIVDRSLEAADDYTWSNRAIIVLADVLNSCFGDTPLTPQRWAALNDAVESWTRARPPSFNPFFYRDGKVPGAFPEIWHGSSCHILGIQHRLLAQMFLVQFNPSVPRVGTTRREATRRMTQQIEALMRELCGLGISNQWTPPAMFTACIGIAMFGDHFSEKCDQEALAEFLRKTETAHARPTAAIQQQLMRAWASDAHN